ncbi:MAG: cbb3-type cytochrome c oxidase subunit I [Acidobacteriia bacterium]|nr:cbb3-type cytochrome c oxidase subunit I [Terriglobia bacterium]
MHTTTRPHDLRVGDGQPVQWAAAYARDLAGEAVYADPAPERRAARVLAAFILTGLAFLALPGTLLGVWNLITIASRHTSSAASAAWIQAHGQAQLFGWVGTFILGISLYVLPKFQGRMPRRFGLAWTVWGLWTLGVGLRWWAGLGTRFWQVGLVVSGILEILALILTVYFTAFARPTDAPRRKPKRPGDLGSWMGMVGFAALGVALAVNLAIAVSVARASALPVYPAVSDREFLTIALWGFAVPMAWGYSTRFVTVFLSLPQPIHSAWRWLSAGIIAVVAASLARQFFLADALALLLTLAAIGALKVFRPSLRPPKTASIYRHYPAFVRISYVWLAVGAALGVLADTFTSQVGLTGASRHAVTVGFLATLIFAIGPRLLPSFLNGRELYSSTLMAASLWILNVGCFLRVSSEAVAYSLGGAAWSVLPVSALLELAAVILFVVNLGLTLKQPLPAWFEPDEVNETLPVYWYVTSYPGTRSLLVRAGLKTLGRVHDVPRSLTLAEAAAADNVGIDGLLEQLREFFSRRQPRRVGRSA